MLNGKVAVITGGTRGIGYSIVKKFLDNGCKVALLGSREETVSQAISELKNINRYYNVFDVFLLTSFTEGEPFVLIEAQAMGCQRLLVQL